MHFLGDKILSTQRSRYQIIHHAIEVILHYFLLKQQPMTS